MKNILSASTIKKLTSEGKKIKKYCDGDGLYLWVYEDGKKIWYYRYSLGKIRRDLYIGLFPALSLADARSKAEEYRSLAKSGIDPIREKNKDKIRERTNSFKKLALEWYDVNISQKTAGYKQNVKNNLEKNILPYIGLNSANSITVDEVIDIIKRIESRGSYDMSHRALGLMNNIFRYGKAIGVCDSNPADGLIGILKKSDKKHFGAPLTEKEVSDVLKAVDSYSGLSVLAKMALKIMPYVFVRPTELISAKWKDIDLDKKEWRYLVTKTKTEHIVPLANQVVEMFKELKRFTGNREYVFGIHSDKHISRQAVLIHYRRLGFNSDKVTLHGWRATARTMLDEILEYPPHIIEQQLAHTVLDPLGRAYNRTKHLEQRREMMQRWADYLDELKLK